MASSDSDNTDQKLGFWTRIWRRLKGGDGTTAPVARQQPQAAPKLQLLSDDYVPVSEQTEDVIVGIDFGTSYSSVAVLGDRGIELVRLQGEPMMPSVVSFPAPGEIIVGTEARARLAGSAQWTITSPKRLLGRLYKDQAAQRLLAGLAFRTFAGSDRYLRFEAHGQIYSAQDICAEILKVLRKRASDHLGREVRAAVLAAPVGFGSLQRSALEQAARQAGLQVKTIISEPTAAVLAQGFEKGWTGKVAVYDFGGGTFDFCVLDISASSFNVLCSGGDPWLGGDDFDSSLAEQLADAFERETAVDLRSRAVEWQKLLFAAEQAKRELCLHAATTVRCDDLILTHQGSKGLTSRVTLATFEQLTAPLVERATNVTERVLHQAGLEPRAVDAVLMTGGTCLLPAVQHAVRRIFGKEPILSEPHLSVVRGTAVQASSLSGTSVARAALRDRSVQEVVGRTIGAGVDGGSVETVFERDTPIPATKRLRFASIQGGQTQMVIRLYEQVTSRIDQSRPLGKVYLKGLRGLPAGQEFVDVTFTLSNNGVLAVNAVVDGRQYTETIRTQKQPAHTPERLDLKGGPSMLQASGSIDSDKNK